MEQQRHHVEHLCYRCQRNLDFIRSLIRQAQAAGELDDRFDCHDLAYGFYGQAHLYIAAHVLMPDYRLNRRSAERIVDLFLAGAGAKKRRTLIFKENQTHETEKFHCPAKRREKTNAR